MLGQLHVLIHTLTPSVPGIWWPVQYLASVVTGAVPGIRWPVQYLASVVTGAVSGIRGDRCSTWHPQWPVQYLASGDWCSTWHPRWPVQCLASVVTGAVPGIRGDRCSTWHPQWPVQYLASGDRCSTWHLVQYLASGAVPGIRCRIWHPVTGAVYLVQVFTLFSIFAHNSLDIGQIDLKPSAIERELNSTQYAFWYSWYKHLPVTIFTKQCWYPEQNRIIGIG
jgi:hypothetical protein